MALNLVESLHAHFDLDPHEAEALLAVYESDGPVGLNQFQEKPALKSDTPLFLEVSLNSGWIKEGSDGRYEMTSSGEKVVEEAKRRS
jgi:hypothetical protein